jgi:catechol 2,3-dioxygenase-like lactoylglutathione lyase family enzyme
MSAIRKRPPVQSMTAHVFVTDIKEACEFYNLLGFRTDFVHGDPPFYAETINGNARLALRRVCEPVYQTSVREREELLSVSLGLNNDVDLLALYSEFKALGFYIQSGPTERLWGALDFIVRDPDENLILFSCPLRA